VSLRSLSLHKLPELNRSGYKVACNIVDKLAFVIDFIEPNRDPQLSCRQSPRPVVCLLF